MRRSIKVNILKIASLAAVVSFLYTLEISLRYILFKSTGGLLGCSYPVIVFVTGCIAGSVLTAKGSELMTRLMSKPSARVFFQNDVQRWIFEKSLTYSSVLVPVLFTIVLYAGSRRILFETITAAVFYIWGITKHNKEYYQVLDRNNIVFGSSVSALALFLSEVVPGMGLITPNLFASAYIFVFILFITRNQFNLERNIYSRRGSDKSAASIEIKRRNIIFTAVIFSITVIIFNIRSIYEFMALVVRKIIAVILLTIYYPIKFVNGLLDKNGVQSTGLNDAASNLQHKSTKGSVFFEALYIVLLIAALHFIIKYIMKRRKRISNFFSRQLRAIINILRKLTVKVNPTVYEKPVILDYTDEVENITKSGMSRNRKGNTRDGITYGINAKRIKNPVQKVRYIYCSLVNSLLDKNVGINKSDTARDIYIKANSYKDLGSDLDDITKLYEKVRYADNIPTLEEIDLYEKEYSNAVKQLKRKNPHKR
ncbi:MAG: hypothetical protein Q8920_08225 [Bacillota bacterium]|nr:hypothetical protein [Bacillota bacterium]